MYVRPGGTLAAPLGLGLGEVGLRPPLTVVRPGGAWEGETPGLSQLVSLY